MKKSYTVLLTTPDFLPLRPSGCADALSLCFKQVSTLRGRLSMPYQISSSLDAELIDISLGTRGAQQMSVLTTDVFEISFVYGSFSLQTHTSVSYSR